MGILQWLTRWKMVWVLSLAFLALLTLAAWWLGRREVPVPAPASQGTADRGARALIVENHGPDDQVHPLREDVSNGGGFKPADVIGNPDCRMLPGRDSASDTALVVLPGDSGAHLGVLGEDGLVYRASLPFVPHLLALGKRTNGSVVAGVGNLRLGSRVFREPDTPEPVRIFQDGQIVYETQKAWDFGVASDGSSFYVQEPLAGEGSRLVVRDLDAGIETHIDLGTAYSATMVAVFTDSFPLPARQSGRSGWDRTIRSSPTPSPTSWWTTVRS